MKQILQHLDADLTEIVECPAPEVKPGHVLVETRLSLVSAGTERMLVDFGRANLLSKARQQPDKVAMVLDKVRTDGLLPTVDAVRSKMQQPIPLGYSNVGTVCEVGAGVEGFKVGDRVASNGPHADLAHVPSTMCAKIPDGVSDDSAAFTVVAAVGLQGLRLIEPRLGESIAVIGAGLIGLLTVQLLIAQGVRVLAIDLDEERLALAKGFGAETCNPANGEDAVVAATRFSRGLGVDGVVITASSRSSDPVRQAAQMARKRGRIVLVGTSKLDLDRSEFYEKELSFQVSCSYGPGRYDLSYEGEGRDYPVAFVRWTAQRNFEAVLDMMAAQRIDTKPLTSARYAFLEADKAYADLTGASNSLGILLDYGGKGGARRTTRVSIARKPEATGDTPQIGFVGAGNYASRILIPGFKKAGAGLHRISSAGGISAMLAGRRYGFAEATTDTHAMIDDPDCDIIVIATRHDQHADLAVRALEAGKHVWVEKPLAITREGLGRIEQAYAASNRSLMVGFNRRFSATGLKMKSMLENASSPKAFIATVNAGALPPDHWTQDPSVGGGRIIGEACHQLDFLRFLADAPIVETEAIWLGGDHNTARDKASISIRFSDGSIGTIHYLANGGRRFPKERIEVFAQGATLQLDNFRSLRGYNWPGFTKFSPWRQDKGQDEACRRFIGAVENGQPSPIAAEELFEVARAAIEISETAT